MYIVFVLQCHKVTNRVKVLVFNATFNNISVILWQSVLLVVETGVPMPMEPAASH
jgi:hypothetical protein